MLPNLIVIGAAKCGTTSLHHYLKMHPEIFMARAKEVNFFTVRNNWSRGLDWYERHFPDDGSRVYGESSTRYTAYPEYTGVPERMATVIPDAKLIYLVRDPIERVVSQYLHQWNEGVETRPIREAVLAPSPNRYLDRSMYSMQLERFRAHFPDSQILVVEQRALQQQRSEVLARIFRFVDVADDFTSPEFSKLLQVTPESAPLRRRSAPALARTVLGPRLFAAVRHRGPRAFRLRLVPPPDPRLDDDLGETLKNLLAPDAERLRALTGMPFASWQV